MKTARQLIAAACAVALLVAAGGCAPSANRTPTSAKSSATTVAPAPSAGEQAGESSEPSTAVSPMKMLAPDKGAWVGVFTPPAPYKMSAVERYTKLAGARPAIVMWYQPWAGDGADEFLGSECVTMMRAGVVPLITWEPWDPGADPNYLKHPEKQPKYSLAKIAGGKYDSYIRDWARKCATLGGPVMLRPMHEMNGTWYPWGGTVNGNSAEEYVAAWRHIHDIFADEGADNVTWVWSVNNNNIPDVEGNQWGDYYPGDEYVDWVASSGFNWGTTRPKHKWKTFDAVFGNVYPYLRTLGKPILLSEFGTVSEGGSKPAWIRAAYRAIREDYPEIAAVVYYDNGEQGLKGRQDWGIASVKGSAMAYAEAVSDPYYKHAPSPAIDRWVEGATDDDFEQLKQSLK